MCVCVYVYICVCVCVCVCVFSPWSRGVSSPLFVVNWLEVNRLLLGDKHPSEVTDNEKCQLVTLLQGLLLA